MSSHSEKADIVKCERGLKGRRETAPAFLSLNQLQTVFNIHSFSNFYSNMIVTEVRGFMIVTHFEHVLFFFAQCPHVDVEASL